MAKEEIAIKAALDVECDVEVESSHTSTLSQLGCALKGRIKMSPSISRCNSTI
jgi:hypothetical protein